MPPGRTSACLTCPNLNTGYHAAVPHSRAHTRGRGLDKAQPSGRSTGSDRMQTTCRERGGSFTLCDFTQFLRRILFKWMSLPHFLTGERLREGKKWPRQKSLGRARRRREPPSCTPETTGHECQLSCSLVWPFNSPVRGELAHCREEDAVAGQEVGAGRSPGLQPRGSGCHAFSPRLPHGRLQALRSLPRRSSAPWGRRGFLSQGRSLSASAHAGLQVTTR